MFWLLSSLDIFLFDVRQVFLFSNFNVGLVNTLTECFVDAFSVQLESPVCDQLDSVAENWPSLISCCGLLTSGSHVKHDCLLPRHRLKQICVPFAFWGSLLIFPVKFEGGMRGI